MKEQEIGVITHYFAHVSAGIIKLSKALKVGDTIHIKGAHDDFTQTVASMQVDHQDITQAKSGDEIAVRVDSPVHVNDKVYKVTA